MTDLLVKAQNLINKSEQKKAEIEFKQVVTHSESYQAALEAYQESLQASGSLEASRDRVCS